MSLRRVLLGLPIILLAIAAGAWFWLLHTESGARWIWSRVESATEGSLVAQEIAGALATGLTGRDIVFTGDGVTVSLAEAVLAVDIDLLPWRVTVLPATVADLRIDLAADRVSEDDTDIRDTLTNLQLPVELAFNGIELDGFVINGIGGDAVFVINTARFEGYWHDAILVENIDIDAPLVDATGKGRIALQGDYDIQIDLDLVAKQELTGFDSAVPIAATVQGPLDELMIQARADAPRAFLRGQVSGISTEVRWNLQLDVPALNLPSAAGAVAIPPLEIVAAGGGDTRTFAAEAQVGFAGTDMRVNVAAEVDVGATTVSSALDWQNAHWPVGDAEPQVSSRAGKVTLSGSLDDWSIAGTVNVEVPQLPPGQFTIDGGGNRDGVSAEILDGKVFGGTIAGRAEYSWRGPRAYTAQLELQDIRTATVLPDWPAVLSGKLSINGQQEPLKLSVLLADVTGTFGDRALQADGRVDIIDGSVSVDNLRVRHGETSVRADGELYAAKGLRYNVFIDDIEYYIEDAFGSIAAAGSLSLMPDAQFLRIDASSGEVGWRGLRFVNLEIADRGDGILDAAATADRIEIGTVNGGQLQLQVRLGRQKQSLDIEMLSDELRSALSVSGVVDSWENPSSWAGQITKLEVEYDEFSAALDDPAELSVSNQSASIEGYCIVGRSGMRSCVDASWHSNAGFDLATRLSSVPVNLVNAFAETGLDFDQVVSGEINWQTLPDGASGGRGDIAITAGKIISDQDLDLLIETGPAKLRFNLDADSLRGGEIDIPFPGLGRIAAEFDVLNITEDGAPDIDGLVKIDLADIGLLVAFIPALDEAGGEFHADLNIAGSVRAPLLSGELALENGSLSYLPIGLRLDEIELDSELQENGEVELTGSFRAGDGRAQIRTRADHALTATKGLEVTLRGENLTIIDVPDIRATANTDLRVNFNGETLGLDGNVAIPHARIKPANIGVTRVYESEDVVIVAGELPDNPTDDSADVDVNFAGSVEVSLGNDVVVDLDVAQTQVTGKTVFTWSGDPIPSALGRFDIDGEILAFGQRLEISEGSVRFDDVPADDPYLRIRAEREIFGNTQVRRAGVLVAGTLARTTVEPYTDPMTTEERALTLLITGSDFDYEKGVGALGVGTYVAPRVYVSYGIAMFDEENVVRVRYDLKRNFGVTVTSGAKESGVDLSFRREN
jgi:translocation and assembly module TamB